MSPLRLHALIFCSWVLSLTGQPVEGGGSTHLQVVAEPGVTIFVDEKSQGETTARQGGLIVPDIKPGEHTLRAEKEDCVPKTIKVNVDAGSVFKWKVGDFVPSLKVIRERGQEKEGGDQPYGHLLIQSLPIDLRVQIPAIGFDSLKSKDEVTLGPLVVDEYRVLFFGLGKNWSAQIKIYDKETTKVFVNLLKGTIRNYTEEIRIAPGEHFKVWKLGIEMRWCPKGSFRMGSPFSEDGRYSDESRHDVTFTNHFWLGKHEITQDQWTAVMGTNPSSFKGANHPVDRVSWEDATEFCRRLNERERKAGRLLAGWAYQLPTEAQWEYACRAGTNSAFAFGKSLSSSQANFDGNYPYGDAPNGPYLRRTAPVGSYQPNAWGLHDMHGNVYEWCRDWYGKYPLEGAYDPVGPSQGSLRVLRGGSWFYFGRNLRSASRYWLAPTCRNFILGFRLSLSPVQER